MWNNIDSRINGALNRIRKAFRGVLTRANSAGAIQTAQLKGVRGEVLQDVELFQQYGFTSAPLPGTQTIILPLHGLTSHSIIIATEHGSYRLKALKPGEVALYTDEGSNIVLKRGKLIEANCDYFLMNAKKQFKVVTENFDVRATTGAQFDTPLLHGTHNVSDSTSTVQAMRDTFDDHDHNHGGDAGTTDKPNQQM